MLPLHQAALAQVEIIEYNYDQGTNGKGRLSLVTEKKGASLKGWTQFAYDERGNITQTDKAIEGVSTPFTTRSTYDSLGRIVDMTYPDGEVMRHSYNAQGLLDKVRSTTHAIDYVANLDYNVLGQITTKTFGNGKTTTYTYHPQNFRLTGLTTPGLQSLTYSYDNVGNVLSINDTLKAATQSFGYDNLHRLTSASSAAAPSYTHSYAYNAIGNMTSGAGKTFTYGSRPSHAPTSDGTSTYAYDGNGNLTTKTTGATTRAFTWDAENRLIRVDENGVTLAAFAYDDAGWRVKKIVGSNTTVYVGKHYECTNSICSKFIFANGERIALRPVGSNEIYYYHADHLGSSSVITNQTGTKVQELAYYPYGLTRISSGSVDVHHKFTSQEFDDTTGLYFYQARYYDPAIARFISADPIGVRRAEPQMLNRYSYTLNNPLKYVDPSGNQACEPNFQSCRDVNIVTTTQQVQVMTSTGSFMIQVPVGTILQGQAPPIMTSPLTQSRIVSPPPGVTLDPSVLAAQDAMKITVMTDLIFRQEFRFPNDLITIKREITDGIAFGNLDSPFGFKQNLDFKESISIRNPIGLQFDFGSAGLSLNTPIPFSSSSLRIGFNDIGLQISFRTVFESPTDPRFFGQDEFSLTLNHPSPPPLGVPEMITAAESMGFVTRMPAPVVP
jgi:RHS repeat-associated protein